jgi:predicted NBD/HSP70 family sugar kinase
VDPARQANLAAVLRRVHRGPVSRAELTTLTGRNRSTVAALVAELVDRRLVVEEVPTGTGSVGRPSPVVRPADHAVAIAVHPEIDAVRVAAVRLGGRVVHRVDTPLDEPPDPETVVAITVAALREIRSVLPAGSVVVGAGVAVPGLVRLGDGHVRFAPHLGWRDAPIAEELRSALGIPVLAANEASLGAAAEWTFGAGRGTGDLLYVNGGTSGIGGGIVAGGVPLLGATGSAGEIGHVTVRSDGVRDTAGLAGTLESEVSLARLTTALGGEWRDQDGFERTLVETTSDRVRAELRHQTDALATALAGAANLLGSERIVLGGFLTALAASEGPRLRSVFEARLLEPLVGEIEIRRAELGADILLIGAASLPFERLLGEVPRI